ncbi:MAG TPA: type II toxin-antitoxin system VapC family toxin [Candidatus Limnocylindria bacterium]
MVCHRDQTSPGRLLIVLDASAAVDYLLAIGAFERIAARIGSAGETLHAPELLDVEVVQGLRRLVRQARLTSARAEAALGDLAGLRIRRYPHRRLIDRIWELRDNVTVFDAAYLALAEALDAPVVTADAALARSPGHRVLVELYR